MKIFSGDANNLPDRVYDPKGETFDDDVYVDTDSGFRVLANEGETVSKEYYKAVSAGLSAKPKPSENKSDSPVTKTK